MHTTKVTIASLIILFSVGLFNSLWPTPVASATTFGSGNGQVITMPTYTDITRIYYEELPKEFPEITDETLAERRELVRKKLEQLGIDDIDRSMFIIGKESWFRDDIEPITWVKHCWTGSGYRVVEVGTNGRQDECSNHGWSEVHKEKSIGLVQVLPSTAKRQCPGIDITNWQGQLECMSMLINTNLGYDHWTTNKLYVNENE